jgi:hypothetical protein
VAHEQCLASLFLRGAEKGGYGKLIKDLGNAFTPGRDNYPKTVQDVYSLLTLFCKEEQLEYLGYWITREGIQPLSKKVEAILNIAPPETRKQLRGFIGMINYYDRDMWIRRAHTL